MNRDVWSDPTIQQIINTSFVFLSYTSTSVQAKAHKSFYPVDKYPYLAVLDPRTNERIWKTHTVKESTDFFMQIMEFIDSHGETPATAETRNPTIDLTSSDSKDSFIYISNDVETIDLSSSPIKPEQLDSIFAKIKSLLPVLPVINKASIQFRFPGNMFFETRWI